MGYDFKQVADCDLPETLKGKGFDIRIIKGFRNDPKAQTEIIYRPADGICKLKGTVAVMYKHASGVSTDEQIQTEDYKALCAFAQEVKSISKYL